MITWILIGGVLSGAGLFALILILAPPAAQPAAALAELDTRRDEGRMREDVRRLNPAEADTPEWVDTLSLRVTSLVRRTGIDLSSLTGDLAVVGRSLERHMVTSVFLGLGGFAAPLFVVALMQIMGAPLGWSVPLLLSVALGVAGLLLPTLRLRSDADEARRDFRHVVGSYLDLVAMSCPRAEASPRPSTPPRASPTTPP